jgi:hypothetical protein
MDLTKQLEILLVFEPSNTLGSLVDVLNFWPVDLIIEWPCINT